MNFISPSKFTYMNTFMIELAHGCAKYLRFYCTNLVWLKAG